MKTPHNVKRTASIAPVFTTGLSGAQAFTWDKHELVAFDMVWMDLVRTVPGNRANMIACQGEHVVWSSVDNRNMVRTRNL